MIICNEVGKKKILENDEYSSVQIKQSQLDLKGNLVVFTGRDGMPLHVGNRH